jgi:hypothetical protein
MTVTEANATIMMEKSALEEISKILVSNKRDKTSSADESAPKHRRNNATCNTTDGTTGFEALHGAAQCGHHTMQQICPST